MAAPVTVTSGVEVFPTKITGSCPRRGALEAVSGVTTTVAFETPLVPLETMIYTAATGSKESIASLLLHS